MFESTDDIGKRGCLVFREYCKEMGYGVRWVPWKKNDPTSQHFQMHCGDCRLIGRDKREFNVEVKFELQQASKNLFIETYSNRKRGKPGWYHNLDECDFLYYGFHSPVVMYVVKMPMLRAFDIMGYPEVPQTKNEQPNDTWGRLVPRQVLIDAKIIRKVIRLIL